MLDASVRLSYIGTRRKFATAEGEAVMSKAKTIGILVAALCAASASRAGDEVIVAKAKLAFTPPSADWTTTGTLMDPVAATLVNKKLNGRITITYTDYDIYGFKVDYGFLKGQLEKNEKNSFKLTKPNYQRISLDDKKFTVGRAARLEFSAFDELGYHHTVVYALNNGTVVYFFSVESLEREWPQVSSDFESLMASVRFTP